MIILAILGFGMLCGWIAQIILGRGTRPNGQSLIAGLVGSLVGGTIANLVSGDGFSLGVSGFVGSILGAIIVLLIWGAVAKPAPSTRR